MVLWKCKSRTIRRLFRSAGPKRATGSCHAEQHAEYDGDVIRAGPDNIQAIPPPDIDKLDRFVDR